MLIERKLTSGGYHAVTAVGEARDAIGTASPGAGGRRASSEAGRCRPTKRDDEREAPKVKRQKGGPSLPRNPSDPVPQPQPSACLSHLLSKQPEELKNLRCNSSCVTATHAFLLLIIDECYRNNYSGIFSISPPTQEIIRTAVSGKETAPPSTPADATPR
ncbi:hypothetical protein L249_1198 [Ophiocordyceps polyrhachis-furcata BCC 54312]|uniref:Uncharacterized protein n=1 Tax=Ophiocordyceps polyrhachis-furcata BCC 54312 TaxID=1330021 RepID=A0A367LFS6_9HYPO|nr:hypothetical protein L249_1198 [Ophiocordyceps polyrhachis-furcata BCC 54312]